MKQVQDISGLLFLLLSVGLISLLLLSSTSLAASAYFEGDGINDICEITGDDVDYSDCNQSVPYLDIVKIVREPIDEDGVVYLTMVLRGEIKEDDSVHYLLWYNNTASTYLMNYSNGVNTGGAYDIGNDTVVEQLADPLLGDQMITVVYPLLNQSFTTENIEGAAYEITEDVHYVDLVPDNRGFDPKGINATNPPNIPGSADADDSDDTPGFAMVLFIVAVLISIVVINEKKQWR